MAWVYTHINRLQAGKRVAFKPDNLENTFYVLRANDSEVLFWNDSRILRFIRNVNLTDSRDLFFYQEQNENEPVATNLVVLGNGFSELTHAAISDGVNHYPICGNRFNVGVATIAEFNENDVTCGSCQRLLN